ncbi:MAG TPA: tRNA (guanosine(37)-N1)-methyltransferase TrmD [Gemmatimonas aurantiaca]|uniref:tRNA (guanine-N(1)-)-methyltransferase n=1 Tax=Gemmatimonas aurantiaca TaxID=173480 RepID=A0A3D4V4G0_9BACT|nr:tRNA (guanosine(37)-N1)-methyltransferase TrmD [Gemmatimonas aurantiaca]
MRINIITIFPEFFAGPLSLSIPAKAAAAGGVQYSLIDLRDFTHDKHRTVDDYPFGGGPGMVMKPGPFFEAVASVQATSPIVLLSPRGRRFSHADAVRFAAGTELTLLCGHYKDIDERVAQHLATEELSLGDFVLSGGEPAALAIVDATVRLLPGAMSDLESARTDSFFDRGISAPSYTRPASYEGHTVPDVLMGGDHAKVAAWRDAESLRRTREAEGRDRADWTRREAESAARDAAIADLERRAADKAAKKAREKARRGRAAKHRANTSANTSANTPTDASDASGESSGESA